MKKYFLYLLKKNLLPLACLTLFCIIIYVLPISAHNYNNWNNYSPTGEHPFYSNMSLYNANISIALGIMSIFIPFVMFAYKMNKRSVDMHYSLPITKTKILLANFLVGLILMYAAYSIAYLVGFILIAIKVERLHLIYYLYFYLASLIPAFIAYAVTSFIFTRANTIIDGVISVTGALCLLPMAAATINFLLHYNFDLEGAAFSVFAPLSEARSEFGVAVINGYVFKWFSSPSGTHSFNSDLCYLIGYIMWTLIAIAATVALVLREKHGKAENSGQISESVFCYKVQIPAYALMLSTVFAEDGIVALCAIAFAVFVLSVIYKRSIKIGWKFAVVLGSCMVGGILLRAIMDYFI